MQIVLKTKVDKTLPLVYIIDNESQLGKTDLSKAEKDFAKEQFLLKNGTTFNRGESSIYIVDYRCKASLEESLECLRRRGAELAEVLNKYHFKSIQVINLSLINYASIALSEGLALSSYQFHKYKKNIFKHKFTLSNIFICDKTQKELVEKLNVVIEASILCKDLVNEPYNVLNSIELPKRFKQMGKLANFSVQVWDKTKIKQKKMGGILAVNQASDIDPSFSILEWKPKNAKNKQPLVLVGKGIVYDTGGLSLKPTPDSMDHMKTDMAGAAAVASTMYAIAKLKVPYHVIALVPSTDNVVGEDAYAPGDIITMMSGLQVEVLNTDAEGRLILADALHYAKSLNPELVIDIATLTGASMRAVGPFAFSYYSTANEKDTKQFIQVSEQVSERLVQHPLWDDYNELLQSEMADLRNIGGPQGGSITAAKFLQHFTDYPWMHCDIAGMAWRLKKENYRSAGASAFGLRLLTQFICAKAGV